MSADLTTYSDILKEYYTDQRLARLWAEDAPLLATMGKASKFPGNKMPIPVRYGIAQGINSQYSNAVTLSQNTSSLFERFELTRAKKYVIARIEGETLRATKDDEGAFVKALTEEIDSALLGAKRQLASDLYRGGWGKVGKIATGGISGSTITLDDVNDVVNFEKGMKVVLGATEDSGALRNSGTTITVSGVNRATGVVTFTAGVVATIAAAAAGDTIFRDGDRQDSATPARRCIIGLEGWLPQTSPSASENFLTVDRSIDPTRLAGQRVTATSVPLEEALIEGAVQVGREGGKLTHYFMSFSNWAKLEKGLGSRVRYSNEDSNDAKIGFKAITVAGPGGDIKCIADAFCPGTKVFGLSMASWKLRFIDKMFVNRGEGTDGLEMLRATDGDNFDSSWAFYGNAATDAPGHNVTIQVA